MRKLVISIILLLAACNKPDPSPELRDPILADLKAKLGATEAAVEAEEKQVAEFQEALKSAAPQTGQAKIAQKRLYEATDRRNKALQMKQYYLVKIESRIDQAKRDYLRAFEDKRDWPDPAEYESYKAQDALLSAPRTWSVKERMKAAQPEKQKSAAGGGH
jgi:hypothetical protein